MKIDKSLKKSSYKYIKEIVDRGYSLDQIKATFIKYDYNPELAENLIKAYKTRKPMIEPKRDYTQKPKASF